LDTMSFFHSLETRRWKTQRRSKSFREGQQMMRNSLIYRACSTGKRRTVAD
jgi:hypothetical protein